MAVNIEFRGLTCVPGVAVNFIRLATFSTVSLKSLAGEQPGVMRVTVA